MGRQNDKDFSDFKGEYSGMLNSILGDNDGNAEAELESYKDAVASITSELDSSPPTTTTTLPPPTTTTATTITQTTTTLLYARSLGDQTETEGMASNYQFTVRGEPNEGKPATLEHHFQVGGPRYEPNMELVKKINKEYEDYVAWEKAETEKAKELEDEMTSKDEALKEKKNQSWDPIKYVSDLAGIRGDLEQNRLFSEYASNAAQNWMKKKEAAAAEMSRATAAWES